MSSDNHVHGIHIHMSDNFTIIQNDRSYVQLQYFRQNNIKLLKPNKNLKLIYIRMVRFFLQITIIFKLQLRIQKYNRYEYLLSLCITMTEQTVDCYVIRIKTQLAVLNTNSKPRHIYETVKEPNTRPYRTLSVCMYCIKKLYTHA